MIEGSSGRVHFTTKISKRSTRQAILALKTYRVILGGRLLPSSPDRVFLPFRFALTFLRLFFGACLGLPCTILCTKNGLLSKPSPSSGGITQVICLSPDCRPSGRPLLN